MAHGWQCGYFGVALLALVGAGAASADPQRRLSLDFDQGQGMAAQGRDAIVDPRSREVFRPTIDKGTKAALRPEIVSNGCLTPPSCLRVSMDASGKGAAKNKIMYSFWSHYKPLPGGEGGRMRIGDGATTRIQFAMKLDRDYDTPPHQMIHFQIFQPKLAGGASRIKNANPGGPVVSLRIVPQSRRQNPSPDVEEFIIVVRNPQAESLYYYGTRDKGVLYRGSVRKGEWNKFAFVLESGNRGGEMMGRIGVWENGEKLFDRPVAWGFNPEDYAVDSKLGFELGSYRSADTTGHQTVYFDDVSVDR